MPNILVADKIAESGLDVLRQAQHVQFDVKRDLSPEQLGEIIGEYDGLVIRSGVTITRDSLARPGRLAAIARAGVGVDNVDLAAATEAGVLVLNTPDANTLSTAEHTFAMILALHRHIPAAHQHVVSGQWKRSQFQGEQLAGKTLGVVGLGRIGQAVAHRAMAFDMRVIAFDPFITGDSALDGTVVVTRELRELLAQADCVTLHASLSDDSKHMIGAEELGAMKTDAKLVNCARGALIDETALADALNGGRIGGAAIDVYDHEPPVDSPLLTATNVVLTPHLAASTAEAQRRVSVDAVEALLAYLDRGEIRSAVNVAGLPRSLSPRQRAFVDLSSRMGTILSPWARDGVERIRLATTGETLEDVAATLSWQAMVGVLGPHLDERLNLVNAREQAKRRGITVEHVSQSATSDRADTIVLETQSRGQHHTIEGTIFEDHRPRILAIDGYRMEIVPERTIVMIFNDDRPGVIGLVGQKVGDAGINIADMALSRVGATALMILKLDGPMPQELRDDLRAAKPPIHSLETIALPPIIAGPTSP